jgi:YD repeat-containing protein
VSRKYFVYKNSEDDDIVCTVPGAAWNNTNNLVTATTRYASGPFLDETQTILRPDGTMSIYGYDSTSTTKTTTVDTGQPDETGTTIVSGTRSVTVVGQTGELVSQTSLDIASGGIVLSQDTVNPGDYDDERRPTRINHLDGTADLMNYDCCGLASTTDRDGVTTSFAYDDLKRLVQSTHLGISSLYTYDPAGNKTSESRVGTDSVAHALHGYAYDVAGRGVAETNATGVITTYSESYNPATGLTTRTTTTAFGTSDQATRIAVYAADGLLLSVTGTAVNPVRYAYGVEPESGVYRLFTQQIKLDLSGNDTPEWTKTYYDMAGRAYKTVYAAASGTPAAQTYFNTYGQLSEQVDPDGVITVFLYNGRGELQDTVLDANRNGSLDLAGLDRVTRNIQDAIHNSTYGCDVQRTRTFVFPNNNDGATSNEISRVERSTDGLRTWNTTPGLSGLTVVSSTQVAYNPVTGIRTETVTAPDGSCVIRTYTNGRLTASTQYAYGGAQTGQTTYTYDANGRLAATIDARNGATSYSYDNADRIVTTTTPPPGNGQSAQTTTSSYDNQGRVWKTVLPDGTSVTNQYYSNGLLYQTSGSRTYPVRYAYDAQGRMTSMTTWSSLAGGTGAATTTWSYDPYRGWLASKRDAAGNGCDYTYSPSGRLSTRLWGRGSPRLQTSYGYDVFGSPSSITYSDGLTPSVSFTYDRRGRQIGVVDGACTISRSYNDANLFTGESYAGGTLGGFSVTNTYDSVLRKGSAGVRNPSGAAFASATYGYDGASRLSTVSGAGSVTYTYLANSPLIGNILLQQSGTTRLAVNKSYDYLNRLVGISSLPTGAPGWSYGCRYNDANQRVQTALADGSFWVYQYDALGQVISGMAPK